MKKTQLIALIGVLLQALMLTACGKSVFTMSENTEKKMTITAENAARDAFFMVGALEVADGEQIVITSELSKGSIRVEIVGAPQESIEEMPAVDGEAIFTADLKGAGSVSGTEVPAGGYLLKATCLEKASGSVQIQVEPVA